MSKKHERFSPSELATCISHYDLGVIHKIRDFPRGSRSSPKCLIEAEKGTFLFKRRGPGRNDLAKVAFAHEVQIHLMTYRFPLPWLIRTCDENRTMLVLDSNIYEMFEYVEGGPYDSSPQATLEAGRALGIYHKIIADFVSDYVPPRRSFHRSSGVQRAIKNTLRSLPLKDRPSTESAMKLVGELERTYQDCSNAAEKLGVSTFPTQPIHGDWHPGNMLFRERKVVGVIDHDSVRIQPRIIDLANAALQFSIIAGCERVVEWPEHVDEGRFKQFMLGYDSINVVSKRECEGLPYLMCEAMIAEAVHPIAATGSFGRLEGFAFLQMVHRKVEWMLAHREVLCGVLEDRSRAREGE